MGIKSSYIISSVRQGLQGSYMVIQGMAPGRGQAQVVLRVLYNIPSTLKEAVLYSASGKCEIA